ncbi:TIGR00300 family protein [Vallicoccus soli]|uniref:ornithine cyclodeaminase n=1 Tax=Vallicoccus soli TaxID=2339232 RepID=A0A3A3Z205_9ACTN|nr:TIGR00300 family protein [Vallicoccus soli]RJK97203.1 TIGR00300 family protein [Vallicoccus soli]
MSETVEIRGHLIDSGVLSGVLDAIREYGADYTIDRFDVGKDQPDASYARLTVRHDDAATLARLLGTLQGAGVNLAEAADALLRPTDGDGVFPEDFYSTTNLETSVRLGGRWVPVEPPEMDCGIVVADGRARTVAVSDVRAGELVVCGARGVRVEVPQQLRSSAEAFEFMNSVVSSEKPQALLVRQVADEVRAVKARGERVLWVAGPAVVHTGAAPAMVALVEAGFVDVLFAGNALATHDIESALYGTSLGVDLTRGAGVDHGHEHHIRAINRIRRAGSIAAAVEQGVLTGGVMHALVRQGAPYVLVGSVRDDGPLPDVLTDVVEGQRAMRRELHDVGVAVMVATMLHSVATGNLLPARVPLFCVDINPATVTKLSDRGSSQAQGIVTDIGLFLETLAGELVPGWDAQR